MLIYLTQVTMTRAGTTQLRTFSYNTAMQLSSVSIPETGTATAVTIKLEHDISGIVTVG